METNNLLKESKELEYLSKKGHLIIAMWRNFFLCNLSKIGIIFLGMTMLLMIASHTVAQSENKINSNKSTSGLISKTISVIAFGTKGDGLQNDAPAIQKALDSGADTITIPPGIYSVDRTLWIGSNTTLKVDSQAVIRLANNAGNHVSVFLLANRNPGNGNSHITVEGGIWDGNNEFNKRGNDGDLYGYTGTALNFVNVKNLVIRNLTIRNPDAFSIRVGEVDDFLIEDIVLDHSVIRPNQDGIHVGGFSHHGIIRRIKAIHPNTPNDDMIAINADDDVERVINLGMRRGPIHDVLVEDIQADGAYNFVRLLSTESLIENITIRQAKGSCRYYAVNINNWRFPVGSGNIRNVRLEQFNISTASNARVKNLIHITLNVRDLYIYDFQRTDESNALPVNTLCLDNKRENIVQLDNNQQETLSIYRIPQGSIHKLWINKSTF